MTLQNSCLLAIIQLALATATVWAQVPVAADFQSPTEKLHSAESLIKVGELREAQDTIKSAIDELNAAREPNAEMLIEAWTQLGNAYAMDELFPLSLASFASAIELSRRHYGLFNENLIELLNLMNQTARVSGDFAAAAEFQVEASQVKQQIQRRIVTNAATTFGIDSPEHLNAKLDYAHWLATFDKQLSTNTYDEVFELIDDHFDNDKELQARTFQSMASRRLQDPNQLRNWVLTNDPFELIRALRLVEKAENPDPVLHASILRDIGDWRLTFLPPQSQNRTAKAYREAWEILGSAENGATLQDELFGQPQVIMQDNAPLTHWQYLTQSTNAPEGRVDLEFEVDTMGRPRNITVLSATPEWMRDDAIEQVQYSVFRPRVENGEIVTSTGQLVLRFRYTPEHAETLEQ